MTKLDARSQHILRTPSMTDDKAMLPDLAEQYGVSADRVRQIEANASKKLRALIIELEPPSEILEGESKTPPRAGLFI